MSLRDFFGFPPNHGWGNVVDHALFHMIEQQGIIMAAFDDLKVAVTKLQTDVDTLLAKAPPPATGPSDADINAVTDQVNAIAAKVVAAP